jgi:hypothetical protein
LGVALAASMTAAPLAQAAPASTHPKQEAHATKKKPKSAKRPAASKSKGKSRRGDAARGPALTSPVLHTVALLTSAAPESGKVRSESWVEFGETAKHLHVRTTSLDPRWKSTETWDSPTFSVGLIGDLGIAPLERFRGRKAYCLDDPAAAPGASGARYREFQRDLLTQERAVLTLVDGLQRDAAARAALPAGPVIDGHATVTWANPAKVSSDLFGEQPQDQYWFDAATGRILRSQHGWPDSWRDYSTWELIPTGADATTVDPPQDLIEAAGCTWR